MYMFSHLWVFTSLPPMTRAVTFCPAFRVEVGKEPMGTSSRIRDAWIEPVSLSSIATVTWVGLTDLTVPVTTSPGDSECFTVGSISSSAVSDSFRTLTKTFFLAGPCTANKTPCLFSFTAFKVAEIVCPTLSFSESKRKVSLRWQAMGTAASWPVSGRDAMAKCSVMCCTTTECCEFSRSR